VVTPWIIQVKPSGCKARPMGWLPLSCGGGRWPPFPISISLGPGGPPPFRLSALCSLLPQQLNNQQLLPPFPPVYESRFVVAPKRREVFPHRDYSRSGGRNLPADTSRPGGIRPSSFIIVSLTRLHIRFILNYFPSFFWPEDHGGSAKPNPSNATHRPFRTDGKNTAGEVAGRNRNQGHQ